MPNSASAISLLIKPVGPDCNLRCSYCFYRQKACLFPGVKQHQMKDSTLEKLIAQTLGMGCELSMFSWQGGEPTLAGLEFFKRIVELQQKHGFPGQRVSNALQTNGTLLDRKWAEFLKEYNFLVGISLDGPKRLHDHYRKDEKGAGTHARVMQNLHILQDVGAEVNILTLVNDRNVQEPDAIYDFLMNTGVKYFQFVPCVEPGPKHQPAFYSITPEDYGSFLCRLFDRWMDSPMDISVRDFDDLMAAYRGIPPGTCIYKERCGEYMLVEHTGEVFTCDFFVLPKWRLGNIIENTISELMKSQKFIEFGDQKTMLSEECQACEWVTICHGGCCKHRTVLGGDIASPSYFCKGYKKLFAHAKSVLESLQAEEGTV